MSRTRFEPIFNEAAGVSSIPRALLLDQVTGSYNGAVPPSSPGVRPLRTISDLPPTYLFTGEEPGLPNWRAEFARLVTTDRQFARAQVNYLWAYLFRNGIVDPPNDWDLRRTDGTQELPPGWAPQNIQPGLLEELADEFIQSGYSLRKSLRLLTNSTVYQLSSSYPTGMWRSGYEDYFAKSNPRRLSAEELVDAVAVATDTVQPIQLNGMTEPIYFAEQLPDSNEPSNSPTMGQLLDRLGRGKRTDTSPRVVRPELLGLLSYQNTAELVARTQASSQGDLLNRATRLAALGLTDEEIVRRLFIATLSRYPTPDEINVVLARRGNNRLQWLSDLQWVLVQKLEFIFLQ